METTLSSFWHLYGALIQLASSSSFSSPLALPGLLFPSASCPFLFLHLHRVFFYYFTTVLLFSISAILDPEFVCEYVCSVRLSSTHSGHLFSIIVIVHRPVHNTTVSNITQSFLHILLQNILPYKHNTKPSNILFTDSSFDKARQKRTNICVCVYLSPSLSIVFIYFFFENITNSNIYLIFALVYQHCQNSDNNDRKSVCFIITHTNSFPSCNYIVCDDCRGRVQYFKRISPSFTDKGKEFFKHKTDLMMGKNHRIVAYLVDNLS